MISRMLSFLAVLIKYKGHTSEVTLTFISDNDISHYGLKAANMFKILWHKFSVIV